MTESKATMGLSCFLVLIIILNLIRLQKINPPVSLRRSGFLFVPIIEFAGFFPGYPVKLADVGGIGPVGEGKSGNPESAL